MPKDILFSYNRTLKPFKLYFRVAAIRVRIVNLVSVTGYCIECFYSAHKREYKKHVGKSWNLEHNAHNQVENKRQNKISNLLFDEILLILILVGLVFCI